MFAPSSKKFASSICSNVAATLCGSAFSAEFCGVRAVPSEKIKGESSRGKRKWEHGRRMKGEERKGAARPPKGEIEEGGVRDKRAQANDERKRGKGRSK